MPIPRKYFLFVLFTLMLRRGSAQFPKEIRMSCQNSFYVYFIMPFVSAGLIIRCFISWILPPPHPIPLLPVIRSVAKKEDLFPFLSSNDVFVWSGILYPFLKCVYCSICVLQTTIFYKKRKEKVLLLGCFFSIFLRNFCWPNFLFFSPPTFISKSRYLLLSSTKNVSFFL